MSTKNISKKKAEATFRAFKKKYGGVYWDTRDASLVFDWDGNGNPAICWESGAPYEWAIEWDNDNESPAGVFCEPYYSCVLVIYPAYSS